MSKHRLQPSEDVPFSWESEPGMSTVAPHAEELLKAGAGKGNPKLPPPPCPKGSSVPSGQGLYVPLPPCPFQGPQRVSYHSSSGWVDDPFLAAYMECTRSGKEQGRVAPLKQKKKKGGGGGPKRKVFGVSCKSVRDVVEDGVVRLSQLPSGHLRGRNTVGKCSERGRRSLIPEWNGS